MRHFCRMGTTFSGLNNNDEKVVVVAASVGLSDLPESCVALVLSYLDPSDICKLALVNSTFRRASSANSVWEKLLPENYEVLLKKVHLDNQYQCQEYHQNLYKKMIFARLCRPIRFDDDTKEFWIENNGGFCMAISWKGLKITGIDDRRRWIHISSDESRFKTIAYLQETWWLEVQGSLEFEFPAGTYSLFFRLQLGRSSKRRGRRVVNGEQIHGWNVKPVQFHISSSTLSSEADGFHPLASSEYCLDDEPVGKWKLYHVGDFEVENSWDSTKLNFSMSQIDCTHNKGGLSFDSVAVYPSQSCPVRSMDN